MKKTEEKYLMNRELSWLKFNDRVLDEAGNSRVPLAERLTFASIYRFGTKEREKIYIGSADFMTRNTIRRVEVAVPILDKQIRERLDHMFEMMMNDDEKGKKLTNKGIYKSRQLSEVKLNSQELFYAMAYSQAEKGMSDK